MGLKHALRLKPNRRRQFEGHGGPFLFFGAGLVLAVAVMLGWVEPATRVQRSAIWGILLVLPFVVYRVVEQLLRSVVRVESTGIYWWTTQRRSGVVSPHDVTGMRIIGTGDDQIVQLQAQNGLRLEIPIEPVENADQFIRESFRLLGAEPPDWSEYPDGFDA